MILGATGGFGGIERIVSSLSDGPTALRHDMTLAANGDSETSAERVSAFNASVPRRLDDVSMDTAHTMTAIRARDADVIPQVAPVAIQHAGHVAQVLADAAKGSTTPAFRSRDKGSMATMGRASAVAELPGGLRMRGTIAWLAWLVLHLLMLAGFRNRVSVLLSWTWNYLRHDHSARPILDQREAMTAETSRGPVTRSWAA